ncbi:MAG TPA: ethanolamine utilization protein EutJ [Acidobacteriaceae bacterium]|nr:ethanolamine utilization protein EutJ [Acidobacteriaceae bacterium]
MSIDPIADELLTAFEASLPLTGRKPSDPGLYTGVDLGTAYIVTAVVDPMGVPVAGVVTRSESSIRDGLVLDYMAAIHLLRDQVNRLRAAGFNIKKAAGAYPPGTVGKNAQAVANVLYAADLEVTGLIDEPSAAAKVLHISDGAVVDIGGGTTGISVIHDGEPIYTADEATGGTHVDLVLAGHFKVEPSEAEKIKTDPTRQREIFPLVTPVFQKMASIVNQHLKGHSVDTLYLVGGTSCFPGIETVMEHETGIPVARPRNPMLVTPLGIALSCAERA